MKTFVSFYDKKIFQNFFTYFVFTKKKKKQTIFVFVILFVHTCKFPFFKFNGF